MPIDTRKVEDRRVIRFNSTTEAFADAQKLVDAERAKRLTALGNWTLGQTLNHLATWIDYAYDGAPPGATPPWYIRVGARLLKKTLLNVGLRPGIRFPGSAEGTFATDIIATPIAL